MSFQALSWAYGLSLGSAPQKAVLIYLAQFAHEDGTCTWPSVLNIQVATELSERAVRKALRELQDKGLIMPGDQRHAALGKNGGTVPRGRRSKVWDLRLNMPVEEFNGVERAEDVRERLRGEERERKVRERERERKHPKPQENMAETASESQSEADSKDIKKTGCTTCTSKNKGRECTTCTPRGACGAPNRLIQTINPSLPTGELPASGKRPGMEDGNNTTTGGDSDAATVMDHLASVRSKLSLTTTEPTKRDLSKIGNLVSRVVKAHDGDRAASLALILAVIDWLPANTFWLRRVDSARRLADNWDQIANDWTVAQIERQRERDAEIRGRDRKSTAKPTPSPPGHHERHVHSLVCEHVLADMRPHEAEFSHEGSLRYGTPSEWQMACMRHADELNRLEGIETAT
ncbi:helix-turn-helix domain-containing protein [Bifidobacterium adolescentis]|uniref:helix-turn-helix domain-containing protein n=1 Tax=Bifidobacterium adolescentis TaxID=1680 RepID=UPI0022E80F30|nr:helix-turn-helix domain-containing protein [Bifidobacterium adolescentis]